MHLRWDGFQVWCVRGVCYLEVVKAGRPLLGRDQTILSQPIRPYRYLPSVGNAHRTTLVCMLSSSDTLQYFTLSSCPAP